MSNYQDIRKMLGQLSGHRNLITVPKVFCRFMGSFEGGAFLNQLIFWSDKGDGEWFYKPYLAWQSEIMLSEYQLRKYIRYCEEKGFLETKLAKVNGAPTLHFHLLFENFTDSFLEFLGMEGEINKESIESEILQNPYMNRSVKHKSTSRSDDEPMVEEEAPPPPSRPASFKTFVKSYEHIFGLTVDPFTGDLIAEWADKITLAQWDYALSEARKANARNWKYLEKVLERVAREGTGGDPPGKQNGVEELPKRAPREQFTDDGHPVVEGSIDWGWRIIEIDGVKYKETFKPEGIDEDAN